MRQLQHHSIFEGPEESRTLALDSVALQKGLYRVVAKMLVFCLVQGSVSPHFLSERLYRQICGLQPLPACIDDIFDPALRAKLKKIADATTLEGAREAVEEATEELSLLGSLQFVGNMNQRDELLAAALHHYVDGRKVEALQQFCEGLKIVGALEMLKAHPTVLKSVFLQDQKPLLASEIVELFKTGRVSGPGSNRRRMEARTIGFWRDWLLQVEDGESILNVGDVLAFATGLRKIPAVGFPTQPNLHFLHPEDGLAGFPTANTCALILRLPVFTLA
ncbi:hypothetical protein CgunFtcFv8_002381 [Champsocephalus gunnari]|uniref:HECT domain-containing protein n=1 Tax=Champsocephalus gunnari TaxID=52237 RepID=A0AAN8CMM3_CHAGU|nr:hypothetical protein CgunFtcFv8_002381 [Champsocephalus gunnari]